MLYHTPYTAGLYECGVVGRKIGDGANDLSCITRTEGHFVHEAVECHIVYCEADRVCGELDAGNLCEVWDKCESEKACATVCVYEECRGGGA